VLLTICLGWLQTLFLLIFASQIARIIGVSHWHMAKFYFLRERERDRQTETYT
jgi:hypothetical protein